ncbi:MAG TPA: phosphatase PAP2 family protein [Vicinamibacterales bacterium]|jgi:undecaprenyl-diphosphatase
MLSPLLHADMALRGWLAAPHLTALDPVMVGLSAAGRGGAVWLVIGALLVLTRRLRLAAFWQVVLAIVLALALNDAVIKPLAARPRPFVAAPAQVQVVGTPASGYSFPSGHSSTAVAGAYMLTAYDPPLRAVLWLLAALIMYSRIYVGAHYPFDVFGGALLGLLVAWVVIGGRDGVRLARRRVGRQPSRML